MRPSFIIALSMGLAFSGISSVSAQLVTDTKAQAQVNHHVTRQVNHIARAQAKGHISATQANQLRSEDAAIRTQAKIDASDGRLSHPERRTLKREEKTVNHQLHKDAQ